MTTDSVQNTADTEIDYQLGFSGTALSNLEMTMCHASIEAVTQQTIVCLRYAGLPEKPNPEPFFSPNRELKLFF